MLVFVLAVPTTAPTKGKLVDRSAEHQQVTTL